ncbi:MAG: GlsB/YeaQ/YmgE family stress response membrane protein [Chloroflexota bacterium]
MGVLVGLLLLLVLVAVLIGITTSLIGLLVMLAVAGVIGWLADLIVPGRLPYGWLGAIVAGLVGAWIGTALIGDFGPALAGIELIPALVGAVVIAVAAELIGKATTGKRT